MAIEAAKTVDQFNVPKLDENGSVQQISADETDQFLQKGDGKFNWGQLRPESSSQPQAEQTTAPQESSDIANMSPEELRQWNIDNPNVGYQGVTDAHNVELEYYPDGQPKRYVPTNEMGTSEVSIPSATEAHDTETQSSAQIIPETTTNHEVLSSMPVTETEQITPTDEIKTEPTEEPDLIINTDPNTATLQPQPIRSVSNQTQAERDRNTQR